MFNVCIQTLLFLTYTDVICFGTIASVAVSLRPIFLSTEPFGSIENLQKTTAPDESVKTTSSDEKDATVITDAKTTSGEFHTTKGNVGK